MTKVKASSSNETYAGEITHNNGETVVAAMRDFGFSIWQNATSGCCGSTGDVKPVGDGIEAAMISILRLPL